MASPGGSAPAGSPDSQLTIIAPSHTASLVVPRRQRSYHTVRRRHGGLQITLPSIPPAKRAVTSAGHDPRIVGHKPCIQDTVGVSRKPMKDLTCRDLPNHDRPIVTGRNQRVAIGGILETPHGGRMSHQGCERLTVVGAPTSDLSIVAGRGQLLAVGRKSDRQQDVVVPLQFSDQLAGLHVPEPHDPIDADRGQLLAVGMHRQRRHRTLMSDQVAPVSLGRPPLPQFLLQVACFRPVIRGCHQLRRPLLRSRQIT